MTKLVHALLITLVAFINQPVAAAISQKKVPSLAPLYETLAPQLHAGGLYLYAVPFETTGRDQTEVPEWWKHCPYSRAISVQGIHDAQMVNRAIAKLSIRIGIIYSSELCLPLSVATYIAGYGGTQIYPAPDLAPIEILKLSEPNEGVVRVRLQSFFEATFAGTNTLLSGFPLPRAAAPHPVVTDLQPGEIAVFRAAQGGPELVARLNPKQWVEMADYIEWRALIAQRKKFARPSAITQK